MNFWPIYITCQIFFKIYGFLKHWFVNSFFLISNLTITTLEKIDKIFALRVSFRNLFQPLYQDYSIIGYAFGFITRFFLILLGIIVYTAIIILAVFIYFIWAASLIFIISKIFIAS